MVANPKQGQIMQTEERGECSYFFVPWPIWGHGPPSLKKRGLERSALSICVLGEIYADSAHVGQCSALKTKLC